MNNEYGKWVTFFMFIKFHFSFKLIMGCYELEKLDIFKVKLFLTISLGNLDYHLFPTIQLLQNNFLSFRTVYVKST